MPKPRIGVTRSGCADLRTGSAHLRRRVGAAGGEAVAARSWQPNGLPAEQAVAMIHGVDGLLVPGGWDVDPPAYGEARRRGNAKRG